MIFANFNTIISEKTTANSNNCLFVFGAVHKRRHQFLSKIYGAVWQSLRFFCIKWDLQVCSYKKWTLTYVSKINTYLQNSMNFGMFYSQKKYKKWNRILLFRLNHLTINNSTDKGFHIIKLRDAYSKWQKCQELSLHQSFLCEIAQFFSLAHLRH